MNSRDAIVVVMATEAHAAELARFYREVWDPLATAESVLAGLRESARRNVATPGQAAPTALVFSGTRIVGYCSSIPQRLWDGSRERAAYWVKGLMVLPEYRNGPIGYLAVKELSRYLECATIMTVAPAARRLFAALGYTDLGAVSNWVRPLQGGVIADRMDVDALGLGSTRWLAGSLTAAQKAGIARSVGSIAGSVIDATAWMMRLSSSHVDATGFGLPSVSELDELWKNVRTSLRASPVRDSAHFLSRFWNGGDGVDEDSNPYALVSSREDGHLVAVAAMRKPRKVADPRLNNLRVATISELLFAPDHVDVGLATLGAIERRARTLGADAITCITSHRALARVLRRQGYLRLAGNVHFFVRDVTGTGQWPTDLTQWWLGRGDGESDASF